MTVKITSKNEHVIVEAQPTGVVWVCSAFLCTFWVAYLTSESGSFKFIDFLLCNFVLVCVLSCLSQRTLTINTVHKTALLKVKKVFFWVKEQVIPLGQIEYVGMEYGSGGQFAKGNSVKIEAAGGMFTIISSDIAPNSLALHKAAMYQLRTLLKQ